jgi:hypothetical protein
MLEQSALWLSALEPPSPAGDGPVRRVLDAATRQPLGHARWPRPQGPAILRALVPWSCRVYESPDDSLLFVCRRNWYGFAAVWVYDADGHRVARLGRHWITSPYGLAIAAVRRDADGRSGRFDGPGGIELACWQPSGGGTLVHFAPDLDHEPLVKMSLLAATLVLSTEY